MGLSFALLTALIVDAVFGEPRGVHPLVIYGRLADRLEAEWNDDTVRAGAKALGVLVLLPMLLAAWFVASLPAVLGWVAVAGLLYVSIGRQSLAGHARPVETALAAGDLAAARTAAGRMVSRETDRMDELAIRRATIESVLENSSDAIIAPLFWAALGALLAGPAGAAVALIAHRLVNTLDAMWGYHTERFEHFGRLTARVDDVLNWPAARVTALAFMAMGHRREAWECWQRQARTCDSPNAGPVMTAGAGALGLVLGGGAWYHGAWKDKPLIGVGQPPAAGDIERALSLVDKILAAGVALVLLVGLA